MCAYIKFKKIKTNHFSIFLLYIVIFFLSYNTCLSIVSYYKSIKNNMEEEEERGERVTIKLSCGWSSKTNGVLVLVVLLNLCPYFSPRQNISVHEKILHLIRSDCSCGSEDGFLMDKDMVRLHSGKMSIKFGKPSRLIVFREPSLTSWLNMYSAYHNFLL